MSNTKESKLAVPATRHDSDDDANSINTIPTSSDDTEHDPGLVHLSSHISHSHDAPAIHQVQTHISIDDTIYDRVPNHRKVVIVALLSFCSFLAPISSTTVLVAVPEVAAEYNTTGTIINLSNALYLIFMGVSPCVWGPLSQVYGRRWICILTAALFTACSVGTALSPTLPAFFIFRILTAIEGTSFLIVGASVIGDIYRPTERATAMGWFLSGTLIGPALGPFIGGVIVTYTSWRVLFYLQTGLGGIATIASYFLLPETIHYAKSVELEGLPLRQKIASLAHMSNPWRVIRLFQYPNLIIACFASSALVWNMYSLLTPIRYILNPRFNLTSPLLGGLFYLAPGFGYIVGTFVGGRYADYMVKKYIVLRGERIAEDRLRSCIPFVGIAIPGCMLIYGWSIDRQVGGVALPVIFMFLQGVAQLFCFPSLNTYCLDVMQAQSAEVISGNYMFRYLFAAAGSALVLPAVEVIGVGWFSTVSAAFLSVSALGLVANVKWGKTWRDRINHKTLEVKGNGGGENRKSKTARGKNETQAVVEKKATEGSETSGTTAAATKTEKDDADMV